ncbi:hypothetical protein AZ032_001254, partial [Klebsiella pneumoniae]
IMHSNLMITIRSSNSCILHRNA